MGEGANHQLNTEIAQLRKQANFVDALVDPLEGDINDIENNNGVKITMECITTSGLFSTRYARKTVGELVCVTLDGRYQIKGKQFTGNANPKNWRIKEVSCNGQFITKFTDHVRRRLLNTPLEMLATAF